MNFFAILLIFFVFFLKKRIQKNEMLKQILGAQEILQ